MVTVKGDMQEQDPEKPIELEIDGVLDLHTFRPKEIIDVVDAYIDACVEKGIPVVRIIHGKGIGVQRDRVHAFLKKCPHVASFGLDSRTPSGWGATVANLKLN